MRPRSRSRRLSGALTTRACSAAMARVRNSIAWARVTSSTRIASRSPRQRGSPARSPESTSRAARTASMSSLLAPARRAGRFGRSTSITRSPRASSAVVSPAPKLPVPSIAHARGRAVRLAETDEPPIPFRIRRDGQPLEDPPVELSTAAVWVCLWVSTPMTTSMSSVSMDRSFAKGSSRCRCRSERRCGRTVTSHAKGGQASDQANARRPGRCRRQERTSPIQDTPGADQYLGHAATTGHQPETPTPGTGGPILTI